MSRLNPIRFAVALAVALTFLYLGCLIVFALSDNYSTTAFFGSVFHGVDMHSFISSDFSLRKGILSAVNVFVLAWLTGAFVAMCYNLTGKKKIG